MNIFRRLPLSRLLIAGALVVALGAVLTALATGLSTGPTPPPQPLANAVHDALAATPVAGVSARIQLTDHLIEGATLQGGGDGSARSNPLLSGGSGRLWISSAGKVRLELQSEDGDTQVLYDGQTLSIYNAAANDLYRIQLPREGGTTEKQSGTENQSAGSQSGGAGNQPTDAQTPHPIPTVAEIQRTIVQIMGHATLSGALPSNVAGQPAYTVRIAPSHDGGLVGGAELAWDAVHGVPLRLALFATGNTAPVLELAATEISYGPVADSVFDLSTPPGATLHEVSAPTQPAGADTTHAQTPDHSGQEATGAAAVQAGIPFKLDAPATLAGMALSEVRAIHFDKHPAALLTYGHGLAGLAVLESQAKSSTSQGSPAPPPSSQLPTVTIGGSAATELPTALGTLLNFERAGVSYTVVGSVTPTTAEAAARGL